MNSACLSPCIGIIQNTKQRKESNRTTEQRCFQACSYCHWSFLLSTNSWLNLFSINVFTCWRFSALAFYFFFPMNKPYQWCFCYWQVTVVLSYSTVWVGGPYLSDASTGTSRLTKLLLKFFLFFLCLNAVLSLSISFTVTVKTRPHFTPHFHVSNFSTFSTLWYCLFTSDGVKTFFSETDRDIGQDRGIKTWDESRHFGFGRDETRWDWDIVKMFETWDTAETQVSRHEKSHNNLTLT